MASAAGSSRSLLRSFVSGPGTITGGSTSLLYSSFSSGLVFGGGLEFTSGFGSSSFTGYSVPFVGSTFGSPSASSLTSTGAGGTFTGSVSFTSD